MQFTTAALVIHILMVSAATVMAWIAFRAAERCDALAHDLIAAQRRLKAVSEEVQGFEQRLQRLTGRVYAQSRRPAANTNPDDYEYPTGGELDPDLEAALALQTAPAVAPGKRR